MPLPFESVREQLMRAGIAPHHAKRYVIELREHLAQAMIDKTPRSLSARAPWAVFALVPVMVLLTVVWAVATVMMRLLGPLHSAWPGGVPDTYRGLIAAVSFVASYLLGPAIAGGCIALALRQRLTSRWVWVGLGPAWLPHEHPSASGWPSRWRRFFRGTQCFRERADECRGDLEYGGAARWGPVRHRRSRLPCSAETSYSH
jgi:hypothetical protein